VTFLAFSQTTDAGKPIVSKNKIPLTKNTLVLPKINADSIIIATETARINGLDKVFRFGFEHNVSVDFFQQAEKRNLPNGKILNQLVIHCPEALSINLIFSQFKLAKGSLLYISSLDGSDFVGAYTSLNNNDANVLGTELVYSERVVIELIEEKEAEGLSMLEIGRIVHGYLNAEELVEKALGGFWEL
jgi:lysyl endopeptidase